MALLVDGDLSRIDDLKAQDSGLLDVTNGEGIDPQTKLELAARAIEADVAAFPAWEQKGSAAQVVVNDALRRWHVLRTLEAVYRDAYFSQLNDRYGQRWHHYEALAAEQGRAFFAGGVPQVGSPLRRPGLVSAELGDGVVPAATYWLKATVLDAAGRESAPSAAVAVSSPVPHSLTVSVPFPDAAATQWNLFAGADEASLALQNTAPMDVNTVWVMGPGGLAAGRPPGDGQAADFVVTRSGLLRRG